MKNNEPLEMSIKVKIKPWTTPNFVVYDDGRDSDGSSVPLKDVPIEVIRAMCARFTDEVMEKAGYGPKPRMPTGKSMV